MSEARLSACRGKAVALVAAIFIAGAASGALGMRMFERHIASAEASGRAAYQDQTLIALDRLTNELSLNQDQVDRVETILDECIMMEADLLTQIRELQQHGRERILEVLEPSQRERFRRMIRQDADGR